jgi:hypothetical protein
MQSIALSRASHKQVWWIILILLVVFAAWLRLSGYNFSLPYIDHPDEPAFYLTGLEWRGLFDNQSYLTAYPPLYIWLNIVAQATLEPLGTRSVAPTIQVLRLISIAFGLLTLVVIALAARRAAGDLAGWIAGAAWAISPLVVENGIYATPDPLLYLLVTASVWLAIESLNGKPWLCVWSVAVGALAILDKYYTLTAVVPGILVAISIARRDHRQGLRYIATQGLLLLVTGVVVVVGITMVGREGEVARESGFANILDFERVVNNIYHAILPLQPTAFALSMAVGIAAYFVARGFRLPSIRLDIVLLCLLMLISVPWLAASFSNVTANERMKDVLPATTTACVLLGIAIAQIALVVPARFGPARYTVALPFLFVFIPQLSADLTLIQNRQVPDNRVVLRQWADDNLEPGTVLVGQENHKTFNPYWGGLEGRHWFDWWVGESFTDNSPNGWHDEQGISYAVIDRSQEEAIRTTDTGQAYLAQMLHLRDFGPSRVPAFVVYRLWRMQYETRIRFGDQILLLGYDQDTERAAPGESVTFRFYWQATTTPADNYSLFIHLLTPDENVPLAQADGAPARPERPTLSWDEPSETLISQSYLLTIPPDIGPGNYNVAVGLYNYQTGQRLSITDMSRSEPIGDALPLTQIEVGV